MSTINIHPDEFGDIIIIYLLDMIRNDDMLPDNERFKELIDIMDGRGLKQIVYKSFLEMDTTTRIKYRRIKSSISGDGNGVARILISKGDTDYITEESLTFDRDLCKQIFRTIKNYRFKNPSKILRENRIDEIIDYCIEQKKKREEQ